MVPSLFFCWSSEGADIQSVIKDNIKIVESNQQHIITNDLVMHGNHIFTLVSYTMISPGKGWGGGIPWGADIQSVIKDNIKIVESNQQYIITNDLVLHGNYIFTLVSYTMISPGRGWGGGYPVELTFRV